MTSHASAVHTYNDFEVTLCDIEPRIYRRFLVPKGATFEDLHKAIQDAGGWKNYHLFDFRTNLEFKAPLIAGVSDDEDPEVPPTKDARNVKLESFFKSQAGIGCVYRYDFGDGWRILVKLHEVVSLPYKFKRALLGGERAFPPEDCGGVGGYERCVEFRKMGIDPWDEAEGLGPWLGKWQPEAFDLAKVKSKFDK